MVFIPVAEPKDFDDPEMQEAAKNLVRGKPLHDALYLLAFVYKSQLICSLDRLKAKAKQDF